MLVKILVVLLCTCHIILAQDGDSMHRYPKPKDKARYQDVEHEPFEFWVQSAQEDLAAKLKAEEEKIEGLAKNTVFFLGDGMSVPTIAAARIFKGQLDHMYNGGEEASLSFEKFPNTGVSKTYCVNLQTSESACTATAYLTGTKASSDTIGVKPNVKRGDCDAQANVTNHAESVLAWAQAAGKSTGIITTTRITHASPAGTYAHIADRDWENDMEVTKDGHDAKKCEDIARQLITRNPGQNINVILGGGRREFTPNTTVDPENGSGGQRQDGENLIDTWIKSNEGKNARYVWNRTEFEKINPNDTDYLLGLFNHDHLDYVMDKQEDPSLPQLVKKAIEILSKNPKGFFLFVEGGRIDHAHHEGRAQKSLMETIVFAEAVETAVNMTKVEDTLILVTADHSHTLSVSGYPDRGNPLFGVVGKDAEYLADDAMPYMTLSYANGPGYRHPNPDLSRPNPLDEEDQFYDKEYRQPSAFPLGSESHGGDDVLIYARGPFAHLLNGVVEQNYIPHVVGYANAMGPGLKYEEQEMESTTGGAVNVNSSVFGIFVSLILVVFFTR